MIIEELTMDNKVKRLTLDNITIMYQGFYASFRVRHSNYWYLNGEKQGIAVRSLDRDLKLATFILDRSVLYNEKANEYIIKKDGYDGYDALGLWDITNTYFAKAELPRLIMWSKHIQNADIVKLVFDDIVEGQKVHEIDFAEQELYNAEIRIQEFTPNDNIASRKGIGIYIQYLRSRIEALRKQYQNTVSEKSLKTFEIEESKIKGIYLFCKKELQLDYDHFVWVVKNADFSEIQDYPQFKAKCKYLIYILNTVIKNKEWYRQSAHSINTEPNRCSAVGTNLPWGWKNDIDKLRG